MDLRLQKEKNFHDKRFQDGQGRRFGRAFYTITGSSHKFYKYLLESFGKNKTILEYGCATGSYLPFLAEKGANIIGIDISNIAIEKAKENLSYLPSDKIKFYTMNAEALDFENDFVDMICGSGILHHLDLRKAFKEIYRVLRPGGVAIFNEPLGHNPFINLFRKLTPNIRTEDEHPLKNSDFQLARKYFKRVDLHFFHLLSLFAIPFYKTKTFANLLNLLEYADRKLFNLLPSSRKYAWQVVVILFSNK